MKVSLELFLVLLIVVASVIISLALVLRQMFPIFVLLIVAYFIYKHYDRKNGHTKCTRR